MKKTCRRHVFSEEARGGAPLCGESVRCGAADLFFRAQPDLFLRAVRHAQDIEKPERRVNGKIGRFVRRFRDGRIAV